MALFGDSRNRRLVSETLHQFHPTRGEGWGVGVGGCFGQRNKYLMNSPLNGSSRGVGEQPPSPELTSSLAEKNLQVEIGIGT